MTNRRVFIKTLGCKVNTFDGNAIGNQFKARGYELVDSPEGADVTVLNTCSVTAAADRESRYLIRRYRRDNPDTSVVVTGCYAQTDSARLAAMTEVDFVVPNQSKDQLVDLIENRTGINRGAATDSQSTELGIEARSKLPDNVPAVHENRQSHFKSSIVLFDNASSSQTRAFVKIQDGCNGFCAYCLIPYARGASRSVPVADALKEINRLIAAGTPEIVLTGIHIGDYGRDLVEETVAADPFAAFVESVMNLPGLKRLRISSLEPGELTGELLAVLKKHEDKFCPHFHLPLQSGTDRTLKAMRRTYNTAEYAAAVNAARQLFPDASFGADVIPGFPGETAEDFAATTAFIKSLDLSYLHVFPYSKRPNTAAIRMPGHVEASVIKERASELRALSTSLANRFAARFTGVITEVLWENDKDSHGRRHGLTRNYLQVSCSTGHDAVPGTTTHCKLKGLTETGRLLALPQFNNGK